MSMDFNDATGKQRSTELIPAGTVAAVEMHIRSGSAGPGGWFKRAKDGRSEALDCEFSVLDGDHARRKFWALLTMVGTTDGHGQMGEANRALLCTILESARGITPKDTSEAAKQARQVESYGDFDGLRFIAKIGVKRAGGVYRIAKPIILNPSQAFVPDNRSAEIGARQPDAAQRGPFDRLIDSDAD